MLLRQGIQQCWDALPLLEDRYLRIEYVETTARKARVAQAGLSPR